MLRVVLLGRPMPAPSTPPGLQDPPPIPLHPGEGAEGGASGAQGGAYRLQFKTSKTLGAGTDASVRVELTDAQGKQWQPYFAQVRVGLGSGLELTDAQGKQWQPSSRRWGWGVTLPLYTGWGCCRCLDCAVYSQGPHCDHRPVQAGRLLACLSAGQMVCVLKHAPIIVIDHNCDEPL